MRVKRLAVLTLAALAIVACAGDPEGVEADPTNTTTPTAADEPATDATDDPEPADDPVSEGPSDGAVDMSQDAEIEATISCIEAEGLVVRRIAGGLEVLPDDSMEESERRGVLEGCSEQHQAAQDVPEFTPEVRGRWYDALVEAAECLREEGVNVSEPPTREAFIEDPSWHPHASAGQVAGYSEGEARRLEEACPQPPIQ